MDGQWKVQGAIKPAQGEEFGEIFETKNLHPAKDAVEQYFVEFAKRHIDGKATRADIDRSK
jgi:hypothetical protein